VTAHAAAGTRDAIWAKVTRWLDRMEALRVRHVYAEGRLVLRHAVFLLLFYPKETNSLLP
jgi:hypothetical protein